MTPQSGTPFDLCESIGAEVVFYLCPGKDERRRLETQGTGLLSNFAVHNAKHALGGQECF
jgi:hypothetical protein